MINLPELDHPADHGMQMHGWHFSQADVREALADGLILNPAIELGTNYCPWNCDFCFTESSFSPKKRKLNNEMSLREKAQLIEQIAELGARSINFVGAGEPTIDPEFFEIVDIISANGMVPIIYTEGSLKLSDIDFCERLAKTFATVVLKMNSLVNANYQNRILLSGSSNRITPKFNYFEKRATALKNLILTGFNASVPTRLAFDTIICRENIDELEDLHRYARENNIFVLMVNYLPSGRSAEGHTNALTRSEQLQLFGRLAQIDRQEYGIEQRGIFPYGGAQPCTIRGTGLFVKINGDVLACPGETIPVGNVRERPLSSIWSDLIDVRSQFDGLCPPRERFWQGLTELVNR